jgi:hypothetical protein
MEAFWRLRRHEKIHPPETEGWIFTDAIRLMENFVDESMLAWWRAGPHAADCFSDSSAS